MYTYAIVIRLIAFLYSHSYSHAHFPCSDTTGELIFQPFWEAVFGWRGLDCSCFILLQNINSIQCTPFLFR